jgi:hypothetical protein
MMGALGATGLMAGCAASLAPAPDLGGLCNSVTFLFSDHLAPTQELGFTDNLLFRLLDSQRPAAPRDVVRSQP